MASDSDEEAGAGALQPEKAKKRLKKMMRETGLEDSSDEEGEEGAPAGLCGRCTAAHRALKRRVATRLQPCACACRLAAPGFPAAARPRLLHARGVDGTIDDDGWYGSHAPASPPKHPPTADPPTAGEGDEESESIMDEEDLDRMAGAAGGAAGAAREPTPEAPLRPAVRGVARGRELRERQGTLGSARAS